MGTVHFELTAETAKAVQSYLNLIQAQGKVADGFKKAGSGASDFEKRLSGVGGSIKNWVAGFGSMAAIQQMVSSGIAGMERATAANIGFEKSMAKVWVNTPQNMGRADELRAKILAMSSAYGITTEEASQMFVDLQTGLGHLGDKAEATGQKTAMSLKGALGLDPKAATDLTIKALQTYGDELDTAGKATDKLIHLSTSLSGVGDPAEFWAATAQSAKKAGLSVNEFIGIIESATVSGGRNRQTISGLTAIFQGLEPAIKQGVISPTAKAEQQMQAIVDLSKTSPATFERFFGKDSAALVEAMARNMGDLGNRIRDVEQLTGQASAKLSGFKMANRASALGSILSGVAQTRENADVIRGEMSTGFADMKLKYEMTKAGADLTVDPRLSVFKDMSAWIQSVLNPDDNNYLKADLQCEIDAADKSGNRRKADYLRLYFGKLTGQTTGTKRRRRDFAWIDPYLSKFTYDKTAAGPSDAEEWARMVESGSNMNAAQFSLWKTLGGSATEGSTSAQKAYRKLSEGITVTDPVSGKPIGEPTDRDYFGRFMESRSRFGPAFGMNQYLEYEGRRRGDADWEANAWRYGKREWAPPRQGMSAEQFGAQYETSAKALAKQIEDAGATAAKALVEGAREAIKQLYGSTQRPTVRVANGDHQ